MDRKRLPSPPPPPRGMGRDDRGRGPPRDPGFDPRGPPPGYRGDYGPRGDDRRRGRSPSPPPYDRYARPRSPSGAYKRSRREDPYYDRYEREPSPGFHGGRRSPPRAYPGSPDRKHYEYDDRRGPGGGRDRDPGLGGPGGPPGGDEEGRKLTFKEFMFKQQDDPSPDEAQARYQQYLVEFHGSALKAEFHQCKDDEAWRSRCDPRSFEKALAKRYEEARDSAAEFAADLASGKMDPRAEGFNQGAYDLAPVMPEKDAKAMETDGEKKDPKEEVPGPKFAPPQSWRPQRIATDLAAARKLMRKLDAEKSISDNPLLPKKEQSAAAAAAAATAAATAAAAADAAAMPPPAKKKKVAGGAAFGNFDAW